MKERIILDFGTEIKNICKGCAEGVKAKCKQTQKDHLQCALQMSEIEEFEVEQVPTTFDELKEMCADLDGETSDISCNILQDEIDISVWNTDNQTKVGNIEFLWWVDTLKMSFGTGLSVDISIPRAWQIIKSLIGEE